MLGNTFAGATAAGLQSAASKFLGELQRLQPVCFCTRGNKRSFYGCCAKLRLLAQQPRRSTVESSLWVRVPLLFEIVVGPRLYSLGLGVLVLSLCYPLKVEVLLGGLGHVGSRCQSPCFLPDCFRYSKYKAGDCGVRFASYCRPLRPPERGFALVCLNPCTRVLQVLSVSDVPHFGLQLHRLSATKASTHRKGHMPVQCQRSAQQLSRSSCKQRWLSQSGVASLSAAVQVQGVRSTASTSGALLLWPPVQSQKLLCNASLMSCTLTSCEA